MKRHSRRDFKLSPPHMPRTLIVAIMEVEQSAAAGWLWHLVLSPGFVPDLSSSFDGRLVSHLWQSTPSRMLGAKDGAA